jgi:sugar/nucleoside kinase (ribokinase family)
MPQSENKPQLDLLTIGDCSIDLFMRIPQNDTNVLKDAQNNMCFIHGSKIMVDGFQTSISGNAVNVAMGSSLLGLNTSIYTETGDDAYSHRIQHELTAGGVDTQYVVKNNNTDTALHAVLVYAGERTIFSYHGKRQYTVKDWPKSKFIYYTSIGEGFENFQAKLVEYIQQNPGVGLVFNPGTYQMAKGINALKNILQVTDILFVNKEEAIRLCQTTDKPVKDLLKNLHEFGVKMCVLTDGANGAHAYDGTTFFEQKVYTDKRPVVDMTGAGDAFSAAFMAAIIYGKSLQEALSWGVINSGSQIKVVGSVDGMLKKGELTKLL